MQLQVLERDSETRLETLAPLPAAIEFSRPSRHRLARRVALAFAIAVGLGVAGALLYMSSVHAAPGNSDGATVILEGKALSAGNITLNHWSLSLDSFWLVDVPFYAIAILLAGVHPQLLHLVPTVVAFGVICVGAWIARFGRRGWAALLPAAAVVVMLGLPTRALASNFLMGPLHVTTVLWCLLAFVAMRRGRFGWSWALAVAFLAIAVLGDLQAAVLGTLPVFLAGGMVALRTRRWRAGAPAVSAAIASAVAAEALRRIALAIGTFSIAGANPRASFHQMISNLGGLLGYGADVQGVGIKSFSSLAQPSMLKAAHAVGLGLVVTAVVLAAAAVLRAGVAGLRNAARRPGNDEAGHFSPFEGECTGRERAEGESWFEDVLLFGFLGACALYVSLTLISSATYDRYLTSVIIFGSILAGRLLGRIGARMRTGQAKAALAAAASLVAVGYFASFASSLATPPPVQTSTALVGYLEAHDLTYGIGDYWSSSIVTVESSDAVVIRPVTTEPGTRYLGRYVRQTTSSWYGGGFEFFVYNTAFPWNSVDAQTAIASFGPPLREAAVGTYRVLSWKHDISVPGDGGYVKYSPTVGS
ncbi:MAG: hypothetical protein ABSD97_15935 [Acidimicrobiales bacterium]